MNYQTQQENAKIALELYKEYKDKIRTYIDAWYKQEDIKPFDQFCEARISQMDAYKNWYRPL